MQRVVSGKSFNLREWKSDAVPYTLTIEPGKIRSTQELGAIY